ncbi:hypothetical protein ACE01N_05180 [Saccharicrinis sp. FJH2]|uniref:hypothetical protein n=1 Tax=unclassified Saccharicrinis TaxID=2646859 RepID=UPI0035D4DEFD
MQTTNYTVLFLLALAVFILNLPFGFWRRNTKKYSFKWFLFIHLPIPAIVLMRIYSGVGFAFVTYPVLVSAFFMGQFVGRKYIVSLNPFRK